MTYDYNPTTGKPDFRPDIYPETYDWAFLLGGENCMIEECIEDRDNSIFLVSTEDGRLRTVKRNSNLDGDNYNAWEEIENA